jgi:hypothetical protein
MFDQITEINFTQRAWSSLSLNELPKARKYIKTVSSVLSVEIRVDMVCQKSL